MKDLINKISKGTVFRTLLAVLSLLNTIVSTGDDMPMWYKIVSWVILAIAVFAVWWYNNDITDAARIGTDITYALKDGKIDPKEVEDIVKKAAEEPSTDKKDEGDK